MGSVQDIFARTFREIRVRPQTSASEGYGAHCTRVGHANDAVMEEMQHQKAEALVNLETATVADRQAVTVLSSSNATLTNELRAATETIATLQQSLSIFLCAKTPPAGAREQQSQQTSQQHQQNQDRDMTPLDPNR